MEQPPDPKEPFNVEVDLSPAKWMLPDSSVVTRPQMMLVLNDLMGIFIKASYFAESSAAKLENVVLDSAKKGENYFFQLRVEEGKEQKNAATSVEFCRCPPPYNGTSCEVKRKFFSIFRNFKINFIDFSGMCRRLL